MRTMLGLVFLLTCLPTDAKAPVGRTVFVGDSITVAAEWATRCGNAISIAKNSGTTRDLVARLPDLIAARPTHVVILAGVNDIALGVPTDETIRNIQVIASATPAVVTVVRVLPVTDDYPRPGYNAKIDALNTRLANLSGVTLDSWAVAREHYQRDGIHLAAAAYHRRTTALKRAGLC